MPFVTYRVTSTDWPWPRRSARAIACFSTLGFHCGSTMKTRLAAVRFRLFDHQRVSSIPSKCVRWTTYPKAPTPVVMMSTGIFGLIAKSSRIRCRLGRGHSPSIRSKGIASCRKCRPTKSNVRVQQENMILQESVLFWDCHEIPTSLSSTSLPAHLP